MVEARFKPMGVDVRSGLGRRVMYEDDGVIRRGDGFGGSRIDLEEEEEEEGREEEEEEEEEEVTPPAQQMTKHYSPNALAHSSISKSASSGVSTRPLPRLISYNADHSCISTPAILQLLFVAHEPQTAITEQAWSKPRLYDEPRVRSMYTKPQTTPDEPKARSVHIGGLQCPSRRRGARTAHNCSADRQRNDDRPVQPCHIYDAFSAPHVLICSRAHTRAAPTSSPAIPRQQLMAPHPAILSHIVLLLYHYRPIGFSTSTAQSAAAQATPITPMRTGLNRTTPQIDTDACTVQRVRILSTAHQQGEVQGGEWTRNVCEVGWNTETCLPCVYDSQSPIARSAFPCSQAL
ncbi:hypothetical protein DFH08DRAFT_968201 [Mycena albidolilacea]|uniref:Uncharacterized protein n=1 Tax=Mycena albidolilacea TaxID=1033008 RepID=A0AAD7EJC1_9AGAR|nr:hypothetical protein DFH08DRAFT_968201 [Mycena albidolilacea]